MLARAELGRLSMGALQMHPADYKLKRLFDITAALVGVILLSPLMMIIGLLVAVFLGRPVLFRQQRPGLNCEPFTVLKFRTMKESAGPSGTLLPDSERCTPFGRLLRSTSLDELPELINVLRGEMSFVGPRPLLVRYLPRYSPYQMRRHEVLPGLTGWAQVNGRNTLNWQEKFAMDVWYVDHRSMRLDLKILALTLWRIVKRDGIDHPSGVGAPEFMGNSAVDAKPVVATQSSND